MTTRETALRQTDPLPVFFGVESIELRDGWSGRVVTRCDVPGGVKPTTSKLPTVAEWQETLNAVVSGGANLPERTVLKHSSTGRVFRARVSVGARPMEIVCKQSTAGGFQQFLLQRVRASRERKTFERAFILLRAGIPTAQPLAVLERRWPRKEAWLVTEAIPDVCDLDRVVSGLLWELDPADFVAVKRALLREVVGLCLRMAEHHLYHRDLKASNILVTDWAGSKGPPRMWLVDLDGVRQGRRPDSHAEWRAVMRLAASLVGYNALTRTDCLRFLSAYLAPKNAWKPRWGRLAREVAEYNRRSRRRKTGKLDGFNGD